MVTDFGLAGLWPANPAYLAREQAEPVPPNDRYQQAAELAAALARALPAEPSRLPHQQLHVDFWIEGRVTALLERGFSLAAGPGSTWIVAALSRGDQLGLRPGDRVKVFGGFEPGGGRFLSSAIWRLLPDGAEIEVKDDSRPAKKPWWKLG